MSERPRISRPRPRIEALSDMVFGLSLSIGAIALIAQPPTSLGDINTHILVFILTFIVLITTWLAYTNVMSVLPIETGTVTLLNIALLLGVSISPFLLNTVEISNPLLSPSDAFMIRDYASILYAIDVAALLAINGFFSHILAQEEKGLVSPELIGRFRANRNILLIFAGLFLLSTATPFGSTLFLSTPIRLYIWFIPIVSFWVRFLRRREDKSNN